MQIYKNFFKFQNLLILKRKWRDITEIMLSIERYKKYLKNYDKAYLITTLLSVQVALNT